MNLGVTSISTAPEARLPILARIRIWFHQQAENITQALSHKNHLQAVFSEMMLDYDRMIAGICLSFARTKEDYEDLRQDVMLNIWRGLDSFRGESAASTWIYRVTLNTCVSRRRKTDRRADISLHELYETLYSTSSPVDRERYALMYRLIGRLRPLDKSILLMRLDSRSYDEIAEVMGLSRNAVASRIKRTKDALRDMYEQSELKTF